MKTSLKVDNILRQINESTKLGDLRKMAKEIKKDHALAMELWSSDDFLPRQLAILIMDKNQLSQQTIDVLCNDICQHNEYERLQLIDWLMANQLAKVKATITLMESWENSPLPLQRRIFW